MKNSPQTLPSDLRRRRIFSRSTKISRQVEELKNPSLQHTSAIEINSHPTASAVITQIHAHVEEAIPTCNKPDSAHVVLTDPEHPTLRSLLVRRVIVSIVNYAFLAFIDQCLVVLQPLMYSSSISLGGLGFSSFTIGIILGVWGVINGIISIFAFPKILRRFGVRRLYIVAFASYLVCLAAFPIMSALAKRSGTADAKVWTVLIFQLTFNVLAYMGYGECCLCLSMALRFIIDRLHIPLHQRRSSEVCPGGPKWFGPNDRLDNACPCAVDCVVLIFCVIGA